MSVRSGYKFGCFHKFIVFSEKFRNPWDSPWDASPKKSQAVQLSQARPMGHESLGLLGPGTEILVSPWDRNPWDLSPWDKNAWDLKSRPMPISDLNSFY